MLSNIVVNVLMSVNCWAAPHRPESPSSRWETATETSTVYWIGNPTRLKQKVLEQQSIMYGRRAGGRAGRQAGHDNKLTQGRKRLPFIEGIDFRLAHQLPEKPVAGAGSKHVDSY